MLTASQEEPQECDMCWESNNAILAQGVNTSLAFKYKGSFLASWPLQNIIYQSAEVNLVTTSSIQL